MMSASFLSGARARAAAPLLLALAVLLAAGCSQPTPEERLEMAYDKIYNQKPRDPLGATIILKDIAKNAEADGEVRLAAYLTLADLYSREFREFDRALEFTQGAIDAFGLDSERGQVAAETRLNVLDGADRDADALQLVSDLLRRDDLPVPRRTRLRLREASLLAATGQEGYARAKLQAMSLEFSEADGSAEVEKLALESLVQTFLPDNPTSAADAYLSFAAAKPDTQLAAQARFGAGFLLVQAGDKERGTPLVDEFIERERGEIAKILNPDEKNGRMVGLARAFEMTGRRDEERNVYEQLITDNPGNAVAISRSLEMMALSFLQEEKFDEASTSLERIATLLPGTPEAERAKSMVVNLATARAQYEQQKAKVDAALGEEAPAAADAATTGTALLAVPEATVAEVVAPIANDAATTETVQP